MKRLLLMSLLGLSAMAMAQAPNPTAAPRRGGKASEVADVQRPADSNGPETAKADADEARTRAQLEEARKRLDQAAREVADLSMRLAHNEDGDMIYMRTGGPGRVVLGVQLDPASDQQGARVLEVSPGGAAQEAGLASGDIIVALDGKSVAGENPGRAVIDHMRDVKPDQKVKVKVLRAGKNKEFVVTARPAPAMMTERRFNIHVPEMGGAAFGDGMPHIQQLRLMWPGEFGGMELASITPKLGAYFGVTAGVLVVQAPDNAAFKLEDGDVIQSIDGRKPDDGPHALRILRSYKSGEKLNLQVLRQRKPLTLAVTMPDRPDAGDDVMLPAMPPAPPVGPVPPVPGSPGMPGGAGTLE